MIVIKIEYFDDEKNLNFEIFNDIEKAFKFVKENEKEIYGIRIIKVNDKRIFIENDELNYEDVSDLEID